MAYGVFVLLLAVCLPLAWLRWYAAVSLAIVLAHVLAAAWAGPDFLKTLKLLALAPVYILRKLWMIPERPARIERQGSVGSHRAG